MRDYESRRGPFDSALNELRGIFWTRGGIIFLVILGSLLLLLFGSVFWSDYQLRKERAQELRTLSQAGLVRVLIESGRMDDARQPCVVLTDQEALSRLADALGTAEGRIDPSHVTSELEFTLKMTFATGVTKVYQGAVYRQYEDDVFFQNLYPFRADEKEFEVRTVPIRIPGFAAWMRTTFERHGCRFR